MNKYYLILFLVASMNYYLTAQFDRYGESMHRCTLSLNNGEELIGLARFNLIQKTKIRFRKSAEAPEMKYALADVTGLQLDSARFKTFAGLTLMDPTGRPSPVKNVLGKLVHDGSGKVYEIHYGYYNPIAMTNGMTVNLLVESGAEARRVIPLLQRVRKKKFEKIKSEILAYLEKRELNCLRDLVRETVREDGFYGLLDNLSTCQGKD
ncbi:MAG: hypothetical protein AAFN92_10575 [Bacteroidota bacterium]